MTISLAYIIDGLIKLRLPAIFSNSLHIIERELRDSLQTSKGIDLPVPDHSSLGVFDR